MGNFYKTVTSPTIKVRWPMKTPIFSKLKISRYSLVLSKRECRSNFVLTGWWAQIDIINNLNGLRSNLGKAPNMPLLKPAKRPLNNISWAFWALWVTRKATWVIVRSCGRYSAAHAPPCVQVVLLVLVYAGEPCLLVYSLCATTAFLPAPASLKP